MGNIVKASDLLRAGEVALVLFTRGALIDLKADGSGSTGNWKLDPDFRSDKVIIYLRKGDSGVNDVYLGDFESVRHSTERNRLVVTFRNMIRVGETESNWFQFANGGQSPTQVVEKD
jgi:hypothetical protein